MSDPRSNGSVQPQAEPTIGTPYAASRVCCPDEIHVAIDPTKFVTRVGAPPAVPNLNSASSRCSWQGRITLLLGVATIAVIMVEKSEAFWRKRTLPVEEKQDIVGGGYRWFRSPNVFAIEHYRRIVKQVCPPSRPRTAA